MQWHVLLLLNGATKKEGLSTMRREKKAKSKNRSAGHQMSRKTVVALAGMIGNESAR